MSEDKLQCRNSKNSLLRLFLPENGRYKDKLSHHLAFDEHLLLRQKRPTFGESKICG